MSHSETFIIAEAGVNHQGSLDMAIRLVDAARAAGADAVKFQLFRPENLVTRGAGKAAYQESATGEGTQFDMLRALTLPRARQRQILEHARKVGILFLASAFDASSVDSLDAMGVSAFKVPSGEITNLPLLLHVARKGRKTFLSTGMSTLGEVEAAVEVFRRVRNEDLVLLHCVTEYPTPPSEVNLRAMLTLRTAFGYPVGYSDHTDGIEIAVGAVALGAEVIEKHFTMDRGLPGPDHRASLEPAELEQLVRAIRRVELALGDGRKVPAPCELGNRDVVRRSVVSRRAIRRGAVIQRKDLLLKRPGTGVLPGDLETLVGLRARRAIPADCVITWPDVKE